MKKGKKKQSLYDGMMKRMKKAKAYGTMKKSYGK